MILTETPHYGLSVVRFSDNQRCFDLFRQFVRDGVPLRGELRVEYDSPYFRVRVENSHRNQSFKVWLTPELEGFLYSYLLTGKNTDLPSYFKDGEPISYEVEPDYLYKHLKGEVLRDSVSFLTKETEGVEGVQIKADYPYGSIDYGFFPHSYDEILSLIENIEPHIQFISDYQFPTLHSNHLTTESKLISKDQKLDAIYPDFKIPTNCILNKTICGCGATWLEIHSERNSIIIEPNIPVIEGKMKEHPLIIGIYGDKIKSKDIVEKVRENKYPFVKIMITPDSFPKVSKALKTLGVQYYKDYFLLFDECEKTVTDIDFRKNLYLPIDDFFKFENKAMVSATPIIIDDPRFVEQGFKVIKIEPDYDYRQVLELKPTNNVNVTVKRVLSSIDDNAIKCVFYNSIEGIKELIDFLKKSSDAHIFCSTKAKKILNKENRDLKVFDTLSDPNGSLNLNKYNFFTSRFYSAVDIKLDYKPIVIMVTQVYKSLPGETPYSSIDPQTEAIQIAGRFRNGIEKLIHVTNTNPAVEIKERDQLEEFLQSQHKGYHKLLGLRNQATENGELFLLNQALEKVDYKSKGFITDNGKINYFRYNNAYLDERIKYFYRYPATLYKAYDESGAFKVMSDSIYTAYTDEERQQLKNKKNRKSERITLLYEIFQRATDSGNYYEQQFMDELKREYSLYVDAFAILGFSKVKELEFKDSDVKKELERIKRNTMLNKPIVIQAVYKVFKPNNIYSTLFINEQLMSIFDRYKIEYNHNGTSQDILFYFEGKFKRTTGGKRQWILNERLFDH